MAQKNDTKAVVENNEVIEVVVATETKETKKEASKKSVKKADKKEKKTSKKKTEVSKEKKETKSKKAKKETDTKSKAKKETSKKPSEKSKEAKKKVTKEATKKTSDKAKKEVKKSKKTEPKVVEVFKEPKKGSLAEMIINASKNKYPYRNEKGMTMLDPKTRKKLTDEEYAKVSLHRDICKELVRLSAQANNFPFSVLVYFAVGTDAHRPIAFNKGYKTINIPKAETILRWLKWFADYNKNPKFYACDKIVHAFTKLYNSYSKKDQDFKALMKQWTKMPAKDGYKTTQFKNMQQFYELLTKPLMITAVVDETSGEEKIVDITPNPLAEGNEPKAEPIVETTATASNMLVLRSYYELDN